MPVQAGRLVTILCAFYRKLAKNWWLQLFEAKIDKLHDFSRIVESCNWQVYVKKDVLGGVDRRKIKHCPTKPR